MEEEEELKDEDGEEGTWRLTGKAYSSSSRETPPLYRLYTLLFSHLQSLLLGIGRYSYNTY